MATKRTAATAGGTAGKRLDGGTSIEDHRPLLAAVDVATTARQANPPERFRQLLREVHAWATTPGVRDRMLALIYEAVDRSLGERGPHPLDFRVDGERSLAEKVTCLAAFHNVFAPAEAMDRLEPAEWKDAALFTSNGDDNPEFTEYRRAMRFEGFGAWWDDPQVRPDDTSCVEVLRRWLGEVRDAVPPTPKPENERGGKRLKEPSPMAFECYRVHVLAGQSQKATAEMLSCEHGRTVHQGQVSKWIAQVTRWLEAGNILPDLPTCSPAKTTIVVDPDVLPYLPNRDAPCPDRPERQGSRKSLIHQDDDQHGDD